MESNFEMVLTQSAAAYIVGSLTQEHLHQLKI